MTAGKPEARSLPLERYFRILEILIAFPEGISLNVIAKALALPKPSAHRLLATMQAHGLVRSGNGRGPTYQIGERVRRMAALGADEDWVRSRTSSILKELSADIGETSYIARLDGHQVRSVAMESPDTPWRGFVLPGKILQPHATASGKAVMAYQSPEIIRKALEGPLEKLTPLTLTERTDIEAEYEQIRKRGYATCIGEVDENLAAAAFPIDVPGAGVIHSLGALGPKHRIVELIESGRIADIQKYAKAVASVLGIRQAPPA